MDFTKEEVDTGAEKVVNWLDAEIGACEDARAGLRDRWRQNEALVQNRPENAGVALYDNFPPRAVPVLSKTLKRIRTVVMKALFGPSTWFQAVPDGDTQERADALEKGVQTILERAGFRKLFRRGCQIAQNTGQAIFKCWLSHDGFQLRLVHPNDFVLAPLYGTDTKRKYLWAHRFWLTRLEVEERASKDWSESGALYPLITEEDAKNLGRKSPDEVESGYDASYNKADSLHTNQSDHGDMVELWEAVARCKIGGKWAWCRFVVSRESSKCLAYEPYIYTKGADADPWFFDLRFHDEEGNWWSANSITQDVVGLCLLAQDAVNLAVAGEMANAATPVGISGGTLGTKIKSIGLGSIVPLRGSDPKLIPFPSTFKSEGVIRAYELIQQLIDGQTSVSQLSQGQEFLNQQTATAASAIIAATAENEGEYPASAADFCEPLAAHVHMLCRRHAGTVRRAYGSALPEAFYGSLDTEVRWQMTGRSAGNSPEAQGMKNQALYAMAQDPMNGLHKKRIVRRVVEGLQLGGSTDELYKTPEEEAAEMALAAQAGMAQAAPGAGPAPAMAPGV